MTDKQSIDKLVKQANQLEQQQKAGKVDLTKISGKPLAAEQPLEFEQPLGTEWLTMANDWQQQSFSKVDINKLTKKTARRIFKTKLIFAIDLIATISIILAFFYLWLFDEIDQATLIYSGFGAFFTPIYMFFSFKIRINSWRMGSGIPTSAISAAISACQSSIQYLQLFKYWSLFLFIPFNWYVYAVLTAQGKPIWLGLILVNSILILMYGISHRMQQKRRNELVELKAINQN